MVYWEWGDPSNPRVLVCVHGLTRQGRDFDALAQDMASDYRVICPDVVGRGQSDWLADPMGYRFATYIADMVNLIARAGVEQVDWVGTSMGGLLGLSFASLRGRADSLVRRLVINDIAPSIDPAGLQRIGEYVGRAATWHSLDEAADALWSISTGFGPHTREQWLALTLPQLLRGENGYTLRSDPAIALALRAATPEMNAAGEALLWQAYDQITSRTLLLRGAESDLLTPATAHAMTQRGPCAQLHEFAGVGHAPMLVQPEQRAVVREFLLSP